jgi:hypothetical protein
MSDKRIIMVKAVGVELIDCLEAGNSVAVYSASHRQAFIDFVEHYRTTCVGQEMVAHIESRHYYLKDGLVSELIL